MRSSFSTSMTSHSSDTYFFIFFNSAFLFFYFSSLELLDIVLTLSSLYFYFSGLRRSYLFQRLTGARKEVGVSVSKLSFLSNN